MVWYRKYKSFNLFFAFIVLAYFLSLFYFQSYIVVTKPLIVASLLGFYIATVPVQNNVFLLGLIFAMLGDISLMFDGELFFSLGLASFLIMQWCYVFVFRSRMKVPQRSAYMFIGVLAIFSALILWLLWPHVGNMKPHIVLYIISIFTMTVMAFLRKPDSSISFYFVFWGAVLFMISDTLLAYNKFVVPIPVASFFVMITYIAAQYGIVRGIVEASSLSQKPATK